jgi:nicotinamide-nucleotide amidase
LGERLGVRGKKELVMKLEKAIGNHLRGKGWTLSIAESCTGGLVCDRITNIPGSSDYFEGGMVTYSIRAKARHLAIPLAYIEKYDPVSSEVAGRMALGVRTAFRTTLGLSVTGIAGPTGGTPQRPVGRVFIAIAQGKRTWLRKLSLKGSRQKIKKEAAQESLKFLYDYLMRYESKGR